MRYQILKLLFIAALFQTCTEPFDLSSIVNQIDTEELLVVEGRITDQNINHIIKLTKTTAINEIFERPEISANVYVVDNLGVNYNFTETDNGIYMANQPFAADPTKSYTLKIETINGKTYSSDAQKINGVSELDDITFDVEDSNVLIAVNSSDMDGNSSFFRYEYEESYKIIVPLWYEYGIEVSDINYTNVDIFLKDYNHEVCYNTVASESIIQYETESLSTNNVSDFEIRNIDVDDFILTHRYSINVKQYTQSGEAYTYFKTLNEFSNLENVFNENQVGFIPGNINSENDINEKVIGFFEVNSLREKRIFFNRSEISDTNLLHPYDCEIIAAVPLFNSDGDAVLYALLNNNYILVDMGLGISLVKKECGDCVAAGGQPEVPDFWIE